MSEAVRWPPGWFQDPTGQHDHRWWDGAAWTAHVADAGVAGIGALPDPSGARTPRTIGPTPIPTAHSGARDPVAVAALAVGLGSIVVAAVPGFGLALPIIAIVLGAIGRSRIRTTGRSGDGLAIGGLATGIGGLLIAIVVTTFAVILLTGSGGELAGAFAEYVACLETRSQAECQVLLEQSLERIVR